MLHRPENLEIFYGSLIAVGLLLAGGTAIIQGFRATKGRFWRFSKDQQTQLWQGRWQLWTIACMSSGLTLVITGLVIKFLT